ncbi:MAG TPA: TonB family protein [Gemmatimonadaceae bacterium]|nr:TonB family protein [Gemmatimonadaceae bacterium]
MVVHSVLGTLLVAGSGRASRHVDERYGALAERVVLHALSAPTTSGSPVATVRPDVAPRRRARPSVLAQLAALTSSLQPVEVATDLAHLASDGDEEPDYAALASGGIDVGAGGPRGLMERVVRRPYARPAARGAFTADIVERTVWPRYNPVPVYPLRLMRQGIEAAYFVTFIVDSTGRVDGRTIAFPTEVHELFATAIRRALARSRFHPAEIGGRPVAQLVQQQFKFEMAR